MKGKSVDTKQMVWMNPDEYQTWKSVQKNSLPDKKAQLNQKLVDISSQDQHNRYFKPSPEEKSPSPSANPVEAVVQPMMSHLAESSADEGEKKKTTSQKKKKKKKDEGGAYHQLEEEEPASPNTRDEGEEEEKIAQAASAFFSGARLRQKASQFVKRLMKKGNHVYLKNSNIYIKKKKIGPLPIILANLFDRKIQIQVAQNMHLIKSLAHHLTSK